MKYTALIIGLLIAGITVTCINLAFFEMPKQYKIGFQHGYVCAFDHESEKHKAIIPYETEKSEYCEKYSKAYDEAIKGIFE